MGVALALAVAIAGCGGGKNQSAGATSNGGAGSSKQYPEFRLGVLVWSGGTVFGRFDAWIQNLQIESLVVQKLVEAGPNGLPKLGLASSIEHPNQTTYVYNIRAGVRFSNGKPLTAADAVYSLDLNRDKLSLVAEAWKDVASVAARGSSTVVVKLKRPNADWSYTMMEGSGIIEKAAAERLKKVEELGTQHGLLIGSGPWKLDSYTPEASVQLSRNPYWSGPPQPAAKISVTVFKSEATMALALRSGAIDAASNYGSQKLFVNIAGTRQLTGAQDIATWMSMNTSSSPLDDVHVRRAIAYATDVNGMIKALYPGGGAAPFSTVIPVPEFGLSSVGSSSQVNTMLNTVPRYDFDLGKAKQELAKSAYPHGFTTEVQAYVGEPVLLSVAQIVAQNLAKIGITVKVKPLQSDEATLPIENKKMFLNEFASVWPSDVLMSLLLSPSNIAPSGTELNWAQYANTELAKLLPDLLEAVNPVARLQLTGKALRIAAAEEPYLPLFMHSVFMAVSDKYVSPRFSLHTLCFGPWMLSMKLAQ